MWSEAGKPRVILHRLSVALDTGLEKTSCMKHSVPSRRSSRGQSHHRRIGCVGVGVNEDSGVCRGGCVGLGPCSTPFTLSEGADICQLMAAKCVTNVSYFACSVALRSSVLVWAWSRGASRVVDSCWFREVSTSLPASRRGIWLCLK